MDKIYLGANYYPEDWDEKCIDEDITKMQECGFNVVRIGEFAWKKDEPEEGKFDFVWLHRVVDKMHDAGISVIMGTPTATPPNWLYRKHPDMAILFPDGWRISHGGRRHCCSCNPDYLRYCSIIVEELAKEFGDDPAIIGWQIDNEIYHFSPGCVCPRCMDSFHRHLTEKYSNVENLNRAWNLNLFSQAYDSIDDVPAPFHAWHNPHITFEWNLSQQDNHVRFVHMQQAILKASPHNRGKAPNSGKENGQTKKNSRKSSSGLPQSALTQTARQEGLSAKSKFARANIIFNLAVCFRRPRYRVFRYRSCPLTTANTCSTFTRTEDFSCSLRLI